MMTVSIVVLREALMRRYVAGTMRNRASCLQSAKLARGSLEKAADSSVHPA